ncbi:hypothetical protein HA402_008194 [Bradysia odoriphaga]|nr:hypothetical protein HA402_008194 [Bradysia odoriphaga]
MNWKLLQYFFIHLIAVKISSANFYGFDKNVHELTQVDFRDFVFNKDYASIVEFYNSFCGACRRYSQTWKSFALDISAWNDVVKVAAIDCSENDELCREYEINYYPSIRYFSPYLKDDPEEKQLGIQSTAREISVMKALTVNYLQNETNIPPHWPDLQPLEHIAEPKDIFNNVTDAIKYAVLVYPSSVNEHIGYELTLDYHLQKEFMIKQINSTEAAKTFGIEYKSTIHVVDRNLKVEALPTEIYYNSKAIKRILEKYLVDHGIDLQQSENVSDATVATQENRTLTEDELNVLAKVKNMSHVVFQADLEKAIKVSLTVEVYKKQEIQGESLHALNRYIAVVKKYSPLGARGENFFESLLNFVNSSSDVIDGASYKKRIQELETETEFFDKRWIGCQGSAPNLRGYSCGLWKLFHHLTVRASNATEDNDPLEVLTTIVDYVKHFFGCTECAMHFQEMAVARDMWNVSTGDDAVLWLWKAHNIVSDRISGDTTDDPEFRKIKFPSFTACPQCRVGFNFSEDDVLTFLKDIHSDENIDSFGSKSSDEIPKSLHRVIDEAATKVPVNHSTIAAIGLCVCILFVVALMVIFRKVKGPSRKLGIRSSSV